jgi:hypothetical protein
VYWPGTSRTPVQYQVLDNLSWVRGSHAFKGGINFRSYHIDQQRGAGTPFGIYPSFTFNRLDASFTGADANSVVRPDGSRVSLGSSGINATDRNNLQTFYNILLGRIGRIDQGFYSDGQSFEPLRPLTLKQRVSEYNVFLQDDWRVTPRLTLNLGLRWELNSVPYDDAGVQVINDKPLDGSQGPVSFVPAGPGTGRQWFKTDWNNFAPNAGFAYDLSGDGRMAVRGGYRLAYQRVITWALNVVEQRQPATSLNQFLIAPRDPSLTGTDTVMRLNELLKQGRIPAPQSGTSLTIANGVPQLSSPTAINRTPPNNRAEQPLFFDENMTTPYMHQFHFGFQRQFGSSTVVDVAYVGTRGVDLLRMTNVNQMDLHKNGFIADFQAAQRNLARNGNPNVGESTGNLGKLYGGTIPTSAYADIQNGNVGVQADALDRRTQGIGLAAAGLPENFFRPNPQFTAAGIASAASSSRYDSLQVQVKRRFSQGLTVAANYTLAKSTDDLSNDTRGAGTELIVPSDPKRPELDEGRSDFDVRHVFRGYFIWDLPFGRGRRFGGSASRALDVLIGGWQINGIVDASSGFPLTVFSGRHTFTFYDANTRVATTSASGVTNRSTFTGSDTNIGKVTRTATGAEFFSAEERAQFQTPAVGETGSGRNLFTGPGFFQFDLAVFKGFKLDDRRRLELRVEIFNALNTVNFSDPTILATSGAFGTITGTRVPPRIIQLGAKFYF